MKKPHTLLYYASLLLLPLLIVLYPGSTRRPNTTQSAPFPSGAPDVRLPLKPGTVRWAVIGDNGTGEQPEMEIANQMQRYWSVVKYDFVTMDGDNIYGDHSPEDFRIKFEEPYKSLLDQRVRFYASLGNHYSTRKSR